MKDIWYPKQAVSGGGVDGHRHSGRSGEGLNSRYRR
jgi:hypothetical protein